VSAYGKTRAMVYWPFAPTGLNEIRAMNTKWLKGANSNKKRPLFRFDGIGLTPQITEKNSKFDLRFTRSRFRNGKCYRTSIKLEKTHV
jgi:hypothetical protein